METASANAGIAAFISFYCTNGTAAAPGAFGPSRMRAEGLRCGNPFWKFRYDGDVAPLVSVVIDNHNYGRYLKQAIDSVLDQEDYHDRVECIVVDDGSTDESHHVIGSFGQKVRSLFQPNQGQATAFNNGFKLAQGEFVCLLDSDDYWHRDKLRRTMPRFDDPKVGVVQHLLRDVTATGRELRHHMPRWPSDYGIDDFLEHRMHLTATSGLIFRKSILHQILPIPKEIFYYLDDLLVVKALFLSRVANIPEVLGFHRIHGMNYCAGGYRSPEKLAMDIEMRTIFDHEIQPWLSRHEKRLSRQYLALEDLEYFRRRILLYMYRGQRVRALIEWRDLVKKYWRTRLGLFRAATCALALISPYLYLKFYEFYSDWGLLATLRTRVLPE